jgi:hypothetical protein
VETKIWHFAAAQRPDKGWETLPAALSNGTINIAFVLAGDIGVGKTKFRFWLGEFAGVQFLHTRCWNKGRLFKKFPSGDCNLILSFPKYKPPMSSSGHSGAFLAGQKLRAVVFPGSCDGITNRGRKSQKEGLVDISNFGSET